MCGYCSEHYLLVALAYEIMGIYCKDSKFIDEICIHHINLYLQESLLQKNFTIDNIQRFQGSGVGIGYIAYCRLILHLSTSSTPNDRWKEVFKNAIRHDEYHERDHFHSLAQRHPSLKITWVGASQDDILPSLINDRDNLILIQDCLAFLTGYYDWWYGDIDSAQENTGTVFDLKAEEELESILPTVLFSVGYLSDKREAQSIIEKIAFGTPTRMPGFDGLDLWVQRKCLESLATKYDTMSLLQQHECLTPSNLFYLFLLEPDKHRHAETFIDLLKRSWLEYRDEYIKIISEWD